MNESYKSTQIEGTQISQDEMYYLKYMKKTDDNQEIQNLKRTIEYAGAYLKSGKQICYELVNEMHKIILDSVRRSQKTPEKIRTTQNWIGPRGCKKDIDIKKYMTYLSEHMEAQKMNIRRANEKDIPRLMELLEQVLQIHADIRPDIFIPGTTKYTNDEFTIYITFYR